MEALPKVLYELLGNLKTPTREQLQILATGRHRWGKLLMAEGCDWDEARRREGTRDDAVREAMLEVLGECADQIAKIVFWKWIGAPGETMVREHGDHQRAKALVQQRIDDGAIGPRLAVEGPCDDGGHCWGQKTGADHRDFQSEWGQPIGD